MKNPSDEEIEEWLRTNVKEGLMDALAYLKQQYPNEDHDWGFVKSALLVFVNNGYAPRVGSQSMRLYKKMLRALPFFVPKRGES